MELSSGNLGSWCEAVVVVLQGLMSSEVELVPGGVTGDVTGSELAKVCQQSHVSVTGRNSIPPSRILSRDPEELWRANGVPCAVAGFETKAETPKSCHGEWQISEQRSGSEALEDIKRGWWSEKIINS